MSHFSVLVIGDNPEKQLELYDENLTTTFADKTEDCRVAYENGTMEAVVFADGRCYKKFDKEIEQYWERKFEFCRSSDDVLHLPDDARLEQLPYKHFYPTLDNFAEKFFGYTKNEEGKYGYWYNPNAKWDWYKLEGGFDALPLKDGTTTYNARWGDIDASKLETPFAVLKNGDWHEHGKMGWWAIVTDEKDEDEWEKEVKSLLADLEPDTEVYMYDCHI